MEITNFGVSQPSPLPEGWTDDMTVTLPPGRTCTQVVTLVLEAALVETPDGETEQLLAVEFELSPEDAARARDRAFGGLVRSAMHDSAPKKTRDPIAWESYQRGIADPSLVARIYPQFASER